MLARLRYLISEGFEIASLSGYDDDSGEGNARITFLEREATGGRRIRSEIFDVDAAEMERCSMLFISTLSKRDP
jgi:hypothetical protein